MTARILSLALVTVLCSLSPAAAGLDAAKPAGLPEPLLGVEIDSAAIRLTVTQCGGTSAGSFRIDVAERDKIQEVTVVRIAKDECKMMPQRETLTYDLKKVGIDPNRPVRIVNPIYGNENIARIAQQNPEPAKRPAPAKDRK